MKVKLHSKMAILRDICERFLDCSIYYGNFNGSSFACLFLADSSLIITFTQNSVKTVLIGKWKQMQLARNQEGINRQ